jgi:hypothetical protein
VQNIQSSDCGLLKGIFVIVYLFGVLLERCGLRKRDCRLVHLSQKDRKQSAVVTKRYMIFLMQLARSWTVVLVLIVLHSCSRWRPRNSRLATRHFIERQLDLSTRFIRPRRCRGAGFRKAIQLQFGRWTRRGGQRRGDARHAPSSR